MIDSKNAKKFIASYNAIDNALRVQGDMRKSISYTEAVHRAARTNGIVKKFEDVLVDYGRLRNAIVHSTNDDYIIAEPHDEVVKNYEQIAELICTPPLAMNTVAYKNVKTLPHSMKVADVMEYIYKSGYSTVPIYKENMLVGIANASRILNILGAKIYEKIDIQEYITKTDIENVVKEVHENNFYTIVSEKVTLDTVLNLFFENRKLLIILITKNASLLEKPLGIITVTDIMDINKILNNYKK